MYLRKVVLALLMVFSVSCVGAKFVPTSNIPRTPKAETCNMPVFSSGVPKRPYVEVGLIEGYGKGMFTSLGDVLPEMRKTACRAGGDAIILKGAQKSTTVSGTAGNVSSSTQLDVTAVVIVWR